MASLTVNVQPVSAPVSSPRSSRDSSSRARARAASASTRQSALTTGLTSAVRASAASTAASGLTSAPLDPTAGDDVVGAVGPSHPGLVTAVVVVSPEDQRRGLAERLAGLGALAVEPAPEAHERVGLPLARDGGVTDVARIDDAGGVEPEQAIHDPAAEILEARGRGSADASGGACEERVTGAALRPVDPARA